MTGSLFRRDQAENKSVIREGEMNVGVAEL